MASENLSQMMEQEAIVPGKEGAGSFFNLWEEMVDVVAKKAQASK